MRNKVILATYAAYGAVVIACAVYITGCANNPLADQAAQSSMVRADDLTKRVAALESIMSQVVPAVQRHEKALTPQSQAPHPQDAPK